MRTENGLSIRADEAAAIEDAPHFTREAKRHPGRLLQLLRGNKYTAALNEIAKQEGVRRRFSKYLNESVGVATQWRRSEAVRAFAYSHILKMQITPEEKELAKGQLSIVRLRADDLKSLASALRPLNNKSPDDSELAAAARVALLGGADPNAFLIYLAVLWLANENVITELRQSSSRGIALHLTCEARLQRARLSIESFNKQPVEGLAHVKVIGRNLGYSFDSKNHTLGVPSADNYESLPSKVFHALAMLSLACNPEYVLKLDDDHRLSDAIILKKMLVAAARESHAAQFGRLSRSVVPSQFYRAWHFGKCADAELGSRLFAAPSPSTWIGGDASYILNRPALWRVLWASLYYGRWLDTILYEDVALGELASKTGIRLVNTMMSGAVSTVDEY